MRRALLAMSAAAVLGCSGGLSLDHGTAYPCDFSQGPGVRDEACSPGWICGVANVCQQNLPEGLPPELAPPNLDGAGPVQPTVTRAAILGLMTAPRTGAQFASIDGLGDWVLSPSVALAVPFTGDPFVAGGVYEPLVGTGYAALALADGGLEIRSEDGSLPLQSYSLKLPVEDLRSAVRSGGEAAVDAIASGPGGQWVVPLDGTGAPTGPLTVDGGQVLDVRRLDPGAVGGTPGALASVAVVADGTSSGILAGPADWHPLADPIDTTGPVRLQHSPEGDVFAVAYRSPSGAQQLSAYSIGIASGYRFVQVLAGCQPCPAGMGIAAVAPTSGQPLAIDVVCTDQSRLGPSRETAAFTVTSGAPNATTGLCTETQLTPPFPLAEAVAFDDSRGGFLGVGGALGTIWTGSSVSDVLPRVLDQVPDGFGTMAQVGADGGTVAKYSLAFTRRYFAVDLSDAPVLRDPDGGIVAYNDGYGVVDTSQAVDPSAGPIPAGVGPRAAVQGADGWLISSDGVLLHVTLSQGQDGVLRPHISVGPQLLDPTGAPSAGPYLGQTSTDAGTFLLSAADSLYLFDATHSALTPMSPLTPQLTPQAGFPIRSLAIDRSPGQADAVHGYAVTSNSLYQFWLGGNPQHWYGQPIVLSANEPVKVWMQDDASPLGRVGFRDGSLYTLPDGLPLAPALRTPDGGADRVLDFANFAGWPFALARSGLYLATWADGGSPTGDAGTVLLDWKKVALSDGGEPWVGWNGRLEPVLTDDGGTVLRIFGDHGVLFDVAHAR